MKYYKKMRVFIFEEGEYSDKHISKIYDDNRCEEILEYLREIEK